MSSCLILHPAGTGMATGSIPANPDTVISMSQILAACGLNCCLAPKSAWERLVTLLTTQRESPGRASVRKADTSDSYIIYITQCSLKRDILFHVTGELQDNKTGRLTKINLVNTQPCPYHTSECRQDTLNVYTKVITPRHHDTQQCYPVALHGSIGKTVRCLLYTS